MSDTQLVGGERWKNIRVTFCVTRSVGVSFASAVASPRGHGSCPTVFKEDSPSFHSISLYLAAHLPPLSQPPSAMSPDLHQSPTDSLSLSTTVTSDGLQVCCPSAGRRFTASYLPIHRNLPPTFSTSKYA